MGTRSQPADRPDDASADETGHYVGEDLKGSNVRSRDGKHLLVCGPSQTGKTASVLKHAVFSSKGPTVTTSTKEDFLHPTQSEKTCILDLLGRTVAPEGAQVVRFSPLRLVHSFEDALLVGRTLMEAAYSFSKSGASNEGYWIQRGSRLTAALLWAAHRGDRPIGCVFRWAASEDTTDPLGCLTGETADDEGARSILDGLTIPDGRGGRRPTSQSSSVWSFASQAVALYAYPGAATAAAVPDLDPDDFVQSTKTLHIVCPSTMAPELGPVIAVIIQALTDAQYQADAAAKRAGGTTPGLLLVLDEVANTAPLPTLPALCSEGAGQGVSLILGTQDRAQLEDRFGAQHARTIVSNCRDRVITTELGDRPFLEDIEALSGAIWQANTSTGSGDAGSSRSTNYFERPRWRAWEIAQLRQHTALVLRGWQPELIALVEWSEDRKSS